MSSNARRWKRFVGTILAWSMVVPNGVFASTPTPMNMNRRKSAVLSEVKTGPNPPDAGVAGGLAETQAGGPCLPLSRSDKKGSQQKTTDANKAAFEARKWGDITFAVPKIWGYERVNTYLDGLLRDIEAVSLADLTQLDPNSQNAAAIQFVQSALEVGVQYNQAAALNNNLLMQSWNTQSQQQLQQTQQYNANLQSLEQQRNNLIQQLAAATSTVNALQTEQLNGASLTAAQTTQLNSAQSSVSTLNSELANLNSAIQSAGAPPTMPSPPTLTTPTVQGPASGTNMSSTFYGLSDLLGKLPSGIQNELTSALQSPSYPATKRLDSFITLLYERLAREVSALQDDMTRDPNTAAYLVQFDVGLYPASRTKNHVARVEFELDQEQCPGCKVYAVYPGQSSYNVANYKGESRSKSFWGNLGFLIGLGVSGAYRKQEDTLRGSLVQSVYTSGFIDDAQNRREDSSAHQERFGWSYGAAPFETLVSPGIRTTFAIVTVPRDRIYASQFRFRQLSHAAAATSDQKAQNDNQGKFEPLPQSCFDLDIDAYWSLRDNPFYQKAHFIIPSAPVKEGTKPRSSTIEGRLMVELPGSAGIDILPRALRAEPTRLHVTSLEYNSVYSESSRSGSTAAGSAGLKTSSSLSSYTINACPPGQCAAVVLALDQPVDPNLVVTVNGTVLTRVRDWRGRATSVLTPAQSGSDLAAGAAPASSGSAQSQPQKLFRNAPGLLESDQLGPDTWYALDSHRILLTISRDIVPEEEFPTIRIADPSRKVTTLPRDLDQGYSEIVTNGFHIPARTQAQLQERILNRFTESPLNSELPEDRDHPGGPYPPETFLPLFLDNPERNSLYAYLGQTGRQILIGFENDSVSVAGGSRFHKWLPSRDQVILEDRDLDLAWSLDCSPQGAQLVCDIPQQQIAMAYNTVAKNCKAENACSARGSVEDLPFVSSLELWVEQYDPDGNDAFYASSPIPLGMLPIEDQRESTKPPVDFVPWQFESATKTSVTVNGCGYLNYFGLGTAANSFKILGRDSKDANTYPYVASTPGCTTFPIPTDAVTRGDIVLVPANVRDKGTPQMSATVLPKTPITIASASLRPFFEKPVVTPSWNSGTAAGKQTASFPADCWTLDFTVGRLTADDTFSKSPSLQEMLNISWPGQPGQSEEIAPCPSKDNAPKRMSVDQVTIDRNSRDGTIALRMVITRKDLPSIPRETTVFRKDFQVAKLRIPQILLPSRLRLDVVGPTQFALRGANANMVDAVTLQGGKEPYTITTEVGADFALVTLPTQTLSGSGPKAAGTAPTITGVALDDSGKSVDISGENFGGHIGCVLFDGKCTTAISAWSPTAIAAALPIGKKIGDVVKVTVVTVPLRSAPASFTPGKPFSTECSSSSTIPCIKGISTDSSGKTVVVSGENFGTPIGVVTVNAAKQKTVSAWSESSIEFQVSAGTKAGVLTIVVISARQTSAPFPFTVGLPTASAKTTAAASKSPTQASSDGSGDQPTTSVAPGTYAVIPLFRVSGSGSSAKYLPVEVKGQDDKPLLFTVTKTSAKPATRTPPSSTTTITVTKTPQSTSETNQTNVQSMPANPQ